VPLRLPGKASQTAKTPSTGHFPASQSCMETPLGVEGTAIRIATRGMRVWEKDALSPSSNAFTGFLFFFGEVQSNAKGLRS
jgi:hypothetical protein